MTKVSDIITKEQLTELFLITGRFMRHNDCNESTQRKLTNLQESWIDENVTADKDERSVLLKTLAWMHLRCFLKNNPDPIKVVEDALDYNINQLEDEMLKDVNISVEFR